MIQKVQPLVAVAGAALLLGERPRARFVWFFLPALAGFWLVNQAHPLAPSAQGTVVIAEATGAAVLWALGTVLGRYLSRRLEFQHIVTLRFFFGLLASALAVHAETVAGVVRHRDAAARDAVVYLERVDGPAPRPAPGHVVMDQKNLAFAPHVLPVVAGTTVDFTNSDDIQHNVFSPSKSAGAFDLGSYSRGEMRSVTMSEPGDVLVLCNIHMEMEAHILVVRDPFFALTDADGRYRIADVPPTVDVADTPVALDLEP